MPRDQQGREPEQCRNARIQHAENDGRHAHGIQEGGDVFFLHGAFQLHGQRVGERHERQHGGQQDQAELQAAHHQQAGGHAGLAQWLHPGGRVGGLAAGERPAAAERHDGDEGHEELGQQGAYGRQVHRQHAQHGDEHHPCEEWQGLASE
ncbi:hypothetical protein F7P85_06735 [Kerstersia gyiorum]|nr:hypothetical protein F7P85_06735 [Kerstersia gyiorum]QBR40160.1 hypothetical protein EHF36_05625 [Kerstersia gyiorum]